MSHTAVYGGPQALDFLDTYCERCHNDIRFSGNWSLSDVALTDIALGKHLDRWELVLRLTRDGAMPPRQRKHPPPSQAQRQQFTGWLQAQLDARMAEHPDPGRTVFRRLNRAEYANAVRDLLHLDVELASALPADDSGYGFDNIADLLSVSGTLVDRYFAVAEKASRLAVGLGPMQPVLTVHQVPKSGSILNQGIPSYERRANEHLPIDSRGGSAFAFYAPQDGQYEISGYLNANTNNEVDRLEENHYRQRVTLNAGPHWIGMSFRQRLSLDERVQTLRNTVDIVPMPDTAPQMLALDFVVDGARVGTQQVPSYHMSERFAQQNFSRDVLQINVEGPFDAQPDGVTPARQHILSCRPGKSAASERRCARQILSRLMRQAYRRPLQRKDTQRLMTLFEAARAEAGFNEAIASAIHGILISPSFLYVVEHDNRPVNKGSNYRISDVAFATRLALFIWSSIPDEALLKQAQRGKLRDPTVLRNELTRMLNDPKAAALTENFAGQWLYLRNLEHHQPDVMTYPEFDVPLRQSMQAETEAYFSHLMRDNGSLLNLIRSDYTFLNERLAQHYGIQGVSGPQLRRVSLKPEDARGGVLGHASLLTLTSYGNHTSVVRRGQWILNSLLAAPPPPPPPDVPALVAQKDGRALTAREQLILHREDPACASCHVKMDPLGLALENFNAIGGYRRLDAGHVIDATAQMPDGTLFDGIQGLQDVLLTQKDQFTRPFTEHMLTYALGRGIEAVDRPTIRAIAQATAADNYRIHSVLLGIVESYPFNYRRRETSSSNLVTSR